MERWTGISSKSRCLFWESGKEFCPCVVLETARGFKCYKSFFLAGQQIRKFAKLTEYQSRETQNTNIFNKDAYVAVCPCSRKRWLQLINYSWASLQGFHPVESQQSSSGQNTDSKMTHLINNCCFPWCSGAADVCRSCVFSAAVVWWLQDMSGLVSSHTSPGERSFFHM